MLAPWNTKSNLTDNETVYFKIPKTSHTVQNGWQALLPAMALGAYPGIWCIIWLILLNLGVPAWIGYLIAVFGLPIVWIPTDQYLQRRAKARDKFRYTPPQRDGVASRNASQQPLIR